MIEDQDQSGTFSRAAIKAQILKARNAAQVPTETAEAPEQDTFQSLFEKAAAFGQEDPLAAPLTATSAAPVTASAPLQNNTAPYQSSTTPFLDPVSAPAGDLTTSFVDNLKDRTDPSNFSQADKMQVIGQKQEEEAREKRIEDLSFRENGWAAIKSGTRSMFSGMATASAEFMDMTGTAQSMGVINPLMPQNENLGPQAYMDQKKSGLAGGEDIMVGKGLRQYAKEQKEKAQEYEYDPESVSGIAGSVVPYAVGSALAIATAPISAPLSMTIGAGVLVTNSLAAVGSGIQEYDEYKDERGLEKDPAARLGMGLIYGTAEFAMEKVQLNKFMPKAFKNKVGSVLFGGVNPEVLEKKGADLIKQFVQSSASRSKMVKDVIRQSGEGALFEGGTELATELTTSFSNWLYYESEDRELGEDFWKQNLMAFAGGSMMGAGLGPLSYASQRMVNNKRRKEAGSVVIAQDKESGESYEIVGPGAKPDDGGNLVYDAIRPNGKPIRVTQDQIGEVVNIPYDTFRGLLYGGLDGNAAVEAQTNTEVVGQAQTEQNDLRARYSPFTNAGLDGTQNIATGQMGGNQVFILGADPINADMLFIDDGNGGKKAVSRNQVSDIQQQPFEDFLNQTAPIPATVFDAENPIQKGEQIEYEGELFTVTGVNMETGQVQLELANDEAIDIREVPVDIFQQMRQPVPQEEQSLEPQQPAAGLVGNAANLAGMFPDPNKKDDSEVKESENNTEADIADQDQPLQELIGKTVRYQGMRGTLQVSENGKLEVVSMNGNRIYELPNEVTIDNLSKEIGIELIPEKTEKEKPRSIIIKNDRSVEVDGNEYSINTNELGNVVSLSYTNEIGQKRTIRDKELILAIDIERNKTDYVNNSDAQKSGKLKSEIIEDKSNDANQAIMDQTDRILSLNMNEGIEAVLEGNQSDEQTLLQAKIWVEDAIERVESYIESNNLSENIYLKNLTDNLYEAYQNIVTQGENVISGTNDAAITSTGKPGQSVTAGQQEVDESPNVPRPEDGADQAGQGQPINEAVQPKPDNQGVDGNVQVEPKKYSINKKSENPAPDFDPNTDVDWEASGIENGLNNFGKIKSSKILEIRGRNSFDQIVGTVRVVGEEASENFEVFFNDSVLNKLNQQPDGIQQTKPKAITGQENVQNAKDQKDSTEKGKLQEVGAEPKKGKAGDLFNNDAIDTTPKRKTTRKKTPEQIRRDDVISRPAYTVLGIARKWLLNGGKLKTSQSLDEKQRGSGIGKGIKDQTGMSGSEMNTFIGIMDNKNGLSIEQAAERIWDNLTEEEQNIAGDDLAIRDALINVLLSERRQDWMDNQDRETADSGMDGYNEWALKNMSEEDYLMYENEMQSNAYNSYIEENSDKFAQEFDEFLQSDQYQEYAEEQSRKSQNNDADQKGAGDQIGGKNPGQPSVSLVDRQVQAEEGSRPIAADGPIDANQQQQAGDGNDNRPEAKSKPTGREGIGSNPDGNVNPKGKAAKALQAAKEAGLNQVQLQTIQDKIDFINGVRTQAESLTDLHENEIFEALNDPKTDRKKLRQQIFNQVSNFMFDKNAPLGIVKQKAKDNQEAVLTSKREEIKKKISDVQSRIRELDKLPKSATNRAETEQLYKEINRLNEAYDKASPQSEAKKPAEQADLFGKTPKAPAKKAADVLKEEAKPGEAKKPTLSEKEQRITDELKALWDDFGKAGNNKLNTGPTADQIIIAGKIIGKATELGFTKFEQVINWTKDNLGIDRLRDNFNAFKAAYVANLAFNNPEKQDLNSIANQTIEQYETKDQPITSIKDVIDNSNDKIIVIKPGVEQNQIKDGTQGQGSKRNTGKKAGEIFEGVQAGNVPANEVQGNAGPIPTRQTGTDTAGNRPTDGTGEKLPGSGGTGKSNSDGSNRADTGSGRRTKRTGPSDVEVRANQVAENKKNYRIPNNYKAPDTFKKAERFDENIKAIELLVDAIQSNKTNFTKAEKETLAAYSGFGGLAEILNNPDGYNSGLSQPMKDRIRKVMALAKMIDPDGKRGVFESIKSSVTTAHFTDPNIVKAQYELLEMMGFQSGKVLDPSTGLGVYFGSMPENMMLNSNLTGIEIDFFTAEMFKRLYPSSKTLNKGYQDAMIPEGSQDLVITNVPFGTMSVTDKTWKSKKSATYKIAENRIHNYFMVKAIESAKEGGMIAILTSNAVMDTPANQSIRQFMSDNTYFIGAVRLPNSAFEGTSGTKVVTDVIFLQKRKAGEELTQKNSFVKSENKIIDGSEANINEYFLNNPRKVLGKYEGGGQYAKDKGYTVTGVNENIQKRIVTALKKEAAEVNYTPSASIDAPGAKEIKSYDGPMKIRSGNVFEKDGNFYVAMTPDSDGNFEGEQINVFKKFIEPLRDYTKIRDVLNSLINQERIGQADDVLNPLRKQLTTEYNKFVKDHGRLNQFRNILLNDIDGYQVIALEKLGDKGEFKGLADIFSKRTINPYIRPSKADSPQEAIIISMNEFNRVNPVRMTELLGEDWVNQSEGLIYKLPNGNYEGTEQYLSGNIYEKMEQVKGLPGFEKNYKALEKVLPEPIPIELITVPLGARYVDADIYSNFLSDILRYDNLKVIFNEADDSFTLNRKVASGIYGSKHMNLNDIIEKVFSDKTIRVNTTVDEKLVFDPVKTAEVEAAAEKIRTAWKTWMAGNREASNRIGEVHNRLLNSTVKRKFDGSTLTFPGLRGVELMPHQQNAIKMLVENNGGVIDHIVGAGKTFIMVAGAMELRRLGVAKKPLIIGKKSTIGQIADTFRAAYPGAKVLAPSEKDFTAANRKKILSQIAVNDWDAVILTHENFGQIEADPEIMADVFRDEIDLLTMSVEDLKGDQMGTRELKALETRIGNLKSKLQELSNTSKDKEVMSFGSLGIDHIMVDESQSFKNLTYSTVHNNVAGLGSKKGVQKTFNMLMGIRYLQKLHKGDKGTTFLSGTPISNTMAELYLILKYLRPNRLQEIGMKTFDSWAKTFAEKSSELEFGVSGQLKEKERFRKFVNVPELARLYTEIADVITDKEVKLPKPALKDGKEDFVLLKPSANLEKFYKKLMFYATSGNGGVMNIPDLDYESDEGKKAKMLKVTDLAAKAAMDLRLVYKDAPYDPNSKLAVVARGAAESYKNSAKHKGVTLIFMDRGKTSSYNEDFNGEAELKRILVEEHGIPAADVEMMTKNSTDAKKDKLFPKVNSGEVRILIGSTENMGTGVNIQERIVSMHHLDIPWTPAAYEQRNGRGLRRGNNIARDFYNNEVDVKVYGVERSLDSYKFELLAIKQGFIDQIKSGATADRIMDEGGADEDNGASFSDFMAAATGNPIIKDKAKNDKVVEKLMTSKKAFDNRIGRARYDIDSIEKGIINTNAVIAQLQKYQEIAEKSGILEKGEVDKFNIKVGKETKWKKISDSGDALLKQKPYTETMVDAMKRGGTALDPHMTFNGYEIYAFNKVLVDGSLAKHYLIGVKDPITGRKYYPKSDVLSTVATSASMTIPNYTRRISEDIIRNETDLTHQTKRLAENKKVIEETWPDSDKLNKALEEQKRIAIEVTAMNKLEGEKNSNDADVFSEMDFFNDVVDPNGPEVDAKPKTSSQKLNDMLKDPEADKPKDPRYMIKDPQTETKAFKDWFGDSKVVDGDGKPLVVYHGTNQDFTEFKGESSAYYFSPNREYSTTFPRGKNKKSTTTRAVYLKSSNLKEVDWEIDHDSVNKYLNSYSYLNELPDGLKGVDKGSKETVYAVFSPTQIKSATSNTGAFDGANPDIRYSKKAADALKDDGKTDSPNTAKLQKEVDRVTDTWQNGPEIQVFENARAIQAAYPDVNFRDLERVPGLFYDGKMILNAAHPFHRQPGGTETVILHESVGHYGMGKMIDQAAKKKGTNANKEYADLMQSVYDSFANHPLMAYVSKLYFGKDPAALTELEQIEMGDEFIAHTAQNGIQDKFIDKVIAKLREILRSLGFSMKMNDAELRAIIAKSARLVAGKPDGAAVNNGTRNMLNDTKTTETPEFKKWFGDSKVVDKDGEPMVVYHGSPKDVDISSFAKDYPSDGIYFTNNQQYAENYTKEFRAKNKNIEFDDFDSTGSIYPVYLNIKNPLILDGKNESEVAEYQSRAFDTDFLTADGYDGIILDYGDGEKEYMAFLPTQIKSSLSNTGAFDGANPDIRYSINDFVPSSKSKEVQDRQENESAYLNNPRYMIDPTLGDGPAADNSRREGFLSRALSVFTPKSAAEKKRGEKPFYETFREGLQDAMLPGRRLIEEKKGKDVSNEADFYTKENLAADKVIFQITQFENDYINPLKEVTDRITKEYKVTFEDTENYLIALHNDERRESMMAEISEKDQNKKDPKWPTGMTKEESDQIISLYEDKVPEDVRETLNEKREAIRVFTLDKSLQSGLISQPYYDALLKKFKNYVPLKGDEDRIEYDVTKYSPIKKAKGRTSKAASPLAYLYASAADAIAHGERNLVFQSFLTFAKENPDNNRYMIKTTYYRKTKGTDGQEMFIEVSEEEATPTKEMLVKGEAIRGFNPEIVKDLKMAKPGELSLPIWVKGQKVNVIFSKGNEQLVKALKNTSYSKVEGVLKLGQKLNGWLSRAFTEYSPEFGLVNATRDYGMGSFSVIADDGIKIWKATNKRYAQSNSDLRKYFWGGEDISNAKNPYLKEFFESGAYTGFSQAKEVRDVYKVISNKSKSIKVENSFPAKLLSSYNKSIENTFRFAYFQALRDQGLDVQKAAAKAKDVTVNFRRRGNWTSGMSATYAFFNAGVQGTERFTRPFFSKTPATKQRAIMFAGGLFASGFMQGMLHNMLGSVDDEDEELRYDKIPEFTKNMNMILPFPGKDSGMVMVPLGYGMNIPFVMGEILSGIVLGKYNPGESLWRSLSVISDSFSPIGGFDFGGMEETPSQKVVKIITPTFAKPVLDLALNSNFAGFSIMSENPWDKTTPRSQKAKPNTSKAAVKVADFLNSATGGTPYEPGLVDINPNAMEYIFRQYGGGPVSFAEKIMMTSEVMADGENPLISDKTRKVPFLSRFYTDTDNNSAVMNRYFKNRNKIQQSEEVYKDYLMDEKVGGAERYFEKNKDWIEMADVLKNYETALKDVNQDIKYLKANGEKEELKEMESLRSQIMKEFNKLINEEKDESRKAGDLLK